MGTIADKLAKLAATKSGLKAALAEKGQTVGDVFSTYPDAVRAIETGGKTATVNLNVAGNAKFSKAIDASGNTVDVSDATVISVPCILSIFWGYPSPPRAWSISDGAELLYEAYDDLSYYDYCFAAIKITGDCTIQL